MSVINTHQCRNCCIKHLSSAAVLAREIMTGYDTLEYRMFLMGNLNEAQEQITGVDDRIAERIREFRLKLFPEGMTFGVKSPDLDWFPETVRLLLAEGSVRPSPPRLPAAPCRCRKPR